MNEELLSEAVMHVECLNEACVELAAKSGSLTAERIEQIKHELGARTRAAIYLLKELRTPGFAQTCAGYEAVMREANAFNGPMEESDEPPSGVH